MAISAAHYCVIRELFLAGSLPQGGALLEIGEANWYGDSDPQDLADEIQKYVTDPARRNLLLQRLADVLEKSDTWAKFDVVKICYEMFFAPSDVQAIDFHGSPIAQHQDLNLPVTLNRRFNVVINHGTAEHIFNVAQVFRTVHERTLPGGVMIHEGPFIGWIDHGFYTFHPTLFFDLAEANGYEITGMFVEEIGSVKVMQFGPRETVQLYVESQALPENAMLLVALTKGQDDRPFQVPRQHGYRGGRYE